VAAHILGRHADFWLVTGDALDFALGSLGLDDPQLRVRLMDPYRTLDAFPEVSEMLKRLKAAGLVTAIRSNGSPDMLDAAMKKAGIESLLDAVLSVELAGVYEPHPNVYQLAVDRLGIPADSIWTASGTPAGETELRNRVAAGARRSVAVI
jgi:2-haloacid dehalogenase